MKKMKIYLLMVFTLASMVFAQDGSVYSRYGIGEISPAFSARRVGFGGLGIAVSDKDNLSSVNPAAWNGIQMTRFEGGLFADVWSVKDETSSANYNNIRFSGFMIGLPLQRDYGLSLVGGMVPFTTVSYDVSHVRSGSDLVDDYTISYTGSGGLSKLFLGTSYRMFDWSIGFAYEYYTGHIDYESKVKFDVGSNYENSNYKQNNLYRGSGFNLGLISSNFAELLEVKQFNEFRLGFALNKVGDIKTDNNQLAISSLGSATIDYQLVDTNIPDKISAGAVFRIYDDYSILLDYVNQDWGKYTVNNVQSSFLNEYTKYSLGFEYKLKDVHLRTSTLEQIAWRGGLSYESSQYSINGEDVNGYSFHAGLSYPLEFGNTIDLAVKYSTRGKTGNNLIEENLIKMYFSMSIGEFWFIRQEK